jgi:intraflagellar transport protein 46
VLDLHLRAASKTTGDGAKDTIVKRLDRADKNSKEIEQWIENIRELHRAKPPASVHYARPMPDVEVLMQEWPHEIEVIHFFII